MPSFRKIEDIGAWQKARALTRDIYSASNTGLFARDFGLRDQIRRASVSIMSNIAEGFERGGAKEFAHFLVMAKGSTGELRAQLHVALDQNYIDKEEFDRLTSSANETARMINGLITYLRGTTVKSAKHGSSRTT